jgi:hypothetical protein
MTGEFWGVHFEQILSLYGAKIEPPTAATTFVHMGDRDERR